MRSGIARWVLIAGVVAIVGVVPFVFSRYVHDQTKRLRVVDPGRVYRSGQMTAPGLANAVARHGIRTIINLQDDHPDPDVNEGWLLGGTVTETELCRRLGVRYIHISPDLLRQNPAPRERPRAIDQFLKIMDDPDTYPVLIHCKAGHHRTGVLVAVYRMEYQGWDRRAAVHDAKVHGFGEAGCTESNEYIVQYILSYHPGMRPERKAVEEPPGAAVGEVLVAPAVRHP